nr:conjugal transfer protein TrbI [Proteus mirabilis]
MGGGQMSNDKLNEPTTPQEPQESPDFLAAPKKGKGVRRLNRVPLFVVGGLIALAVVGITYTFYERQNLGGRVAVGPQPPVNTTNLPPVKPSDYSPPEVPTDMPAATPNSVTFSDVPTEQTAQQAAPAQMSEAMQNRLRVIQRIEERKLAQWEAALGSDGTVQSFGTMKTGAGDASQGASNDPYAMLRDAAMVAANSAPSSMGGMGGGGGGMAAENRQNEKQAFLSGSPAAETYLNQRRTAAINASQEVKAGTVIPGVMISGLNSDLPGQIIAQVRENVYDSATGQSLLIPAGARLVGIYDSNVTLGQERALVGWQRIIYPDGSSISLDRMPGADVAGYAGFNDKVNNHYWRIFGNGLLLSVFSAGIQLSQPQASNGENYSSSQIIAGSIGQQMGQLGMQMAQRNMNIQPTLEVRPGYQFNVMVTKDIILPTWTGHPLAK